MINPTFKMRWSLNLPKAKKAVADGRERALDKAGSMVRQSAKKQFSRRSPAKQPTWTRVGTHDGYPLVSMRFQTAKAGKVTTWKPKEFLRSKIFYEKDRRAGSVVIGPDEKVANVQQLHEFGGSQGVKLVLVVPSPVKDVGPHKVPRNMLGGPGRRDRKAYVGMWHSTGKRKRGKVVQRDPGRAPAGRFMEKGLQAKRNQISPLFRNAIQGP